MQDAFLQAILENPDEDSPRLIYADWLDEHGDPDRAEFIRLQIELAHLPEEDPRRPHLERQEKALLARPGNTWAGPLVALARRWAFLRGSQFGNYEATVLTQSQYLPPKLTLVVTENLLRERAKELLLDHFQDRLHF